MFPAPRLGVAATALLVICSAGTLQAQDSTMMKQDAMAKDMMDHGMMMDDGMMGPHAPFAGAHGHTVTGGYSIVEKDGGKVLMLSDDFALDGAPDPYIVLSATDKGRGKGTLNLGLLDRLQGASSFAIPAGTDLGRYRRVLVWCRKYDVTLGRAELAAPDTMMHN